MHEIRYGVAALKAAFPPNVNGRAMGERLKDGAPKLSAVAQALLGGGFELPEQVADGEGRERTILGSAGYFRNKGIKQPIIERILLDYNQLHISPPLPNEVVLEKARRYEEQTPPLTHTSAIDDSDGSIRVLSVPPPKREYAFSNQATLGALCTLGGSGGTSKTTLVMQTAVAAADGKALGGMQVAEGSSVLFLGEEDQYERDRRIGGICAHTHADTKKVAERVKCFPCAGKDVRLTMLVNSNPQETPLVQEAIRLAKEHEAQAGVPLVLIVFDHARLVLGGDANAADHVTQLTRALTHIAHQTGAAVVLLAHSPKSVLSKPGAEINAADIAGSSAFVDNSRSAFMMYGMRADEAKTHHISEGDRGQYVRLENVKANYARPGGGYWFRRVYLPAWDIAVLEQVNLHSAAVFMGKAQTTLRQRILDAVQKKPAGITVRKMRGMSGKDGPLGASEAKVTTTIDGMLEEGVLELRKPTEAERRAHKLTGQVREVLVPGPLMTVMD